MATIGYTSQGALEFNAVTGAQENPVGLKVTLPVDGLFSSASFYGRRTLGNKNVTIAIYSDAAGTRGSLLYTTQTGLINIASPVLYTMNFASPPTLTAGTYWLQVNIATAGAGAGNGFVNYDTGGAANSAYSLDNGGTPVYDTNQYSVFATYTSVADGGFSIAFV